MAQFEFDRDEVEGVLSGRFYSQRETTPTPTEAQSDKPTHYKVICISIYNDDLKHLDELVGQLKKRGMTKANRSALIRAALQQVDLDRVPRGI
ncbi:MAG TPA: hypothetical protein VH054_08615 [Polyangiaceae bacterium]|jgi:hypothetical protein|nr:hypothetical protein [Polyangiaceae bacterium]